MKLYTCDQQGKRTLLRLFNQYKLSLIRVLGLELRVDQKGDNTDLVKLSILGATPVPAKDGIALPG